jgi:hypothetical protein
MRTVLVTVETPQGRADLEISGDVPIGELLPLLLEALGLELAGAPQESFAVWRLGPRDGDPFPAARTLIECGVVDGKDLCLQDAVAWQQQRVQHVTPAEITPSPSTGGVGVRWNRGAIVSD